MTTPEKDTNIDLKGLGLKVTGPRLKILDVFKKSLEQGNDRHLSAEEVFKILVSEGEDIGLATVYRVLSQFAAAGILVRRTFETGTAVYEFDDGHHHDHMICVKCVHVEEFNDPEIEAQQALIAKKFGYELCDHTMALYGVCPKCQKEEKR